MAATAASAVSACPRRQSWMAGSMAVEQRERRPWIEDVPRLAELFGVERTPLIWIDAADVNTLRAVVELAQATGATVHVGASTGAEIVQRVVTSEGWLGSSLAEVATHADLIVTLGDGLLSESPLLSQRFIQPALAAGRAQWFHLSSRSESGQPGGASVTQRWPRDEWYARLTALLWNMQPNGCGISDSPDLQQLSSALLQARSSVWLWDVDEFYDAIDELTIRRLLGICQFLSASRRSSLLCLETNVGRVTAHESLLWLTGCNSTARYTNDRWLHPQGRSEFTLDQWSTNFDAILAIQTVPTASTLPDLPGAHYLVPATRLPMDRFESGRVTQIAAVGVGGDGHLFRGDRATLFLCQGAQASEQLSPLPTAAEVLRAVQTRLAEQGVQRVD